MGGGGQALKRIPHIKFPRRHSNSSPSPSGSASGTQASSSASDVSLSFFSSPNASATVGGKASLQPKRTPVSNEEIEAILLGGCFRKTHCILNSSFCGSNSLKFTGDGSFFLRGAWVLCENSLLIHTVINGIRTGIENHVIELFMSLLLQLTNLPVEGTFVSCTVSSSLLTG